MKNITVYCGANSGTNENIKIQGAEFGKVLGQSGKTLIYGAGGTGMMGIIARACRDNGGAVYGIIPEFLSALEKPIEGIDLSLVKTMHIRKKMMFDKADAFVIFPGGLGTLDEVFEILTWKTLNLHDKPVVFVNIDGFWDALLSHISQIVEMDFSSKTTFDLFNVVQNQQDVLELLDNI